MITGVFDPASPEILDVGKLIEPVPDMPETVIISFSQRFSELLSDEFSLSKVSECSLASGTIPVCAFESGGRTIGWFQTVMGAPAAVALLEELRIKGAKRFLVFGSCGSLDPAVTSGNLLIPTAAARDEGTSYHYAPPSDYIDIPSSVRLAEIFGSLGVPFTLTKTWTTDAFYRETKSNVEKRLAEGCGVVEMECAAVMAFARFRNVGVYQFLYAADSLSGGEWERRLLGRMPDDMRREILHTAVRTAEILDGI